MKTDRIGIYAGTFNPVHAGHVTFALQALKEARLDKVYFLPERQPRSKQGVEHFAHRVAMLKQAARPHRRFGVLELPDVNFTPARTLPQLRRIFGPNAQLVFLFGSDVVVGLPDWPGVDRLLRESELAVSLRNRDVRQTIEQHIRAWPVQPRALHVVASAAPNVSSGSVREALRLRAHVPGLLSSVRQYSDRHWLYVSLA